MRTNQALLLLACMALWAALYWGCERTPPEIKRAEKSRTLTFEKINIASQIDDALERLPEESRSYAFSTMAALEQVESDTTRISILKSLSGFWFQQDRREIASHYAEQIAKKTETSEAWGIAGTSYVLCSQTAESDVAEWCRDKAVSAFENAISLDPTDVDHRINMALAYVNKPLQDQPMKGILMLREIREDYPENVGVLIQLARLSIQTGQWENALKRLQSALELEPNDVKANCMISRVYAQLGNDVLSNQYKSKCTPQE